MAQLFKFSLFLFITTILFTSCSDDDNNDNIIIEYSNLPSTAKNLKEVHFAKYTVTSVTEKYIPDSDGTYYIVYLTDGYELDFDKTGNWVSMEASIQSFPASLFGTEIPLNIKTYTDVQYPNQRIKEVDKTILDFSIKLNNNVNLVFDISGDIQK